MGAVSRLSRKEKLLKTRFQILPSDAEATSNLTLIASNISGKTLINNQPAKATKLKIKRIRTSVEMLKRVNIRPKMVKPKITAVKK